MTRTTFPPRKPASARLMRSSESPELLPELPHRLFGHLPDGAVHAGDLGADLAFGSALDAEAVAAHHRLQPQGQVPVGHPCLCHSSMMVWGPLMPQSLASSCPRSLSFFTSSNHGRQSSQNVRWPCSARLNSEKQFSHTTFFGSGGSRFAALSSAFIARQRGQALVLVCGFFVNQRPQMHSNTRLPFGRVMAASDFRCRSLAA